ncbi:hypothetical protein D3C78_1648640 [compost metagenome]
MAFFSESSTSFSGRLAGGFSVTKHGDQLSLGEPPKAIDNTIRIVLYFEKTTMRA